MSLTTANAMDSMIRVVNPTDGSPIADVPVASLPEVDRVIDTAAAAFTPWRRLSAFDRADLLQAFAARLRTAIPEIAALMARESGKPILEAQFELDFTARTFDYYAGIARNRGGRVAPAASSTSHSLVLREPLGVVAAIVPWNFPILLWAWKAAPALAAGNTVVVKSAPQTPLGLAAVAKLLDLPEGVHSLLQGDSAVGRAMIDHPAVAKVAFTGSSTVGKVILAQCAASAKRVSVEMSGHDALIVWDDVDLEASVEAALFASFTNNGQVCTSAERIYIKADIFDAFAARFTERVRKLVIGNPLDPRTEIGPLVGTAHRARIEAYLERAAALGARTLTGGRRIDGPGAFFEPTVLTGLSHEDLNDLGEIFGPVAPLVPVSTFDEAIARTNDNRFGLSAHVLVSDLELAMRAATEIQVGTVWINNSLIDNLAAPFGGFREAGLGRELGEEGFDAFTETKHVWIEHALRMQPWWFGPRRALLAAPAEHFP